MGSFWPKPIGNPLSLLSSRASVGSASVFNHLASNRPSSSVSVRHGYGIGAAGFFELAHYVCVNSRMAACVSDLDTATGVLHKIVPWLHASATGDHVGLAPRECLLQEVHN